MRTNENPLTSIMLSLFVVILLLLPVRYVKAAPLQPFGTLNDIVLEKLTGKERVLLVLSKQADIASEIQSDGSIQVRLNGVKLSDRLQRIIGEGTLSNVTRIRPVQVDAEGKSWVVLHIDLKDRAPYSIRPQGTNFVIEFTLISQTSTVEPKLAGIPQAGAKTSTNDPEQTKVFSAAEQKMQKTSGRFQDDRRMTIDFDDRDIKIIFWLLGEESGKNFVLGDEIKGNITVHMRNSTWKEILDSILFIKNLEMHEQGNTIRVMTREAMAKYKTLVKAAAIASAQDNALITRIVPIKYRLLKFVFASKIDMKRDVFVGGSVVESAPRSLDGSMQQKTNLAGAVSLADTRTQKVSMEGAGDFFALLQSFLSSDSEGKQRGWIGADADTNSIIITAIERDMAKIMDMITKIDIPTDQILIKANIVETTKSMARDLGITWGGQYNPTIGDRSGWITPKIGFPATPLKGTAALLDLSYGTIAGNILDLQLSALQKDGKLNILSSPSIMTMDNQLAITENGEKIPIRTLDKDGNPTTTYFPATLLLEITPHVIDSGNLKMDIKVKKDEVDMTRTVLNNPFIINKETKTNLIVQDGETIVISGLTKQKNEEGTTGLPWFKDVPVLGWLFKGEQKGESMEEVLIFITPTIIKPKTVTGIQTGP